MHVVNSMGTLCNPPFRLLMFIHSLKTLLSITFIYVVHSHAAIHLGTMEKGRVNRGGGYGKMAVGIVALSSHDTAV